MNEKEWQGRLIQRLRNNPSDELLTAVATIVENHCIEWRDGAANTVNLAVINRTVHRDYCDYLKGGPCDCGKM